MTNTLSFISDLELCWCQQRSCHILRTRMAVTTQQAHSCLGTFALAVPSAWRALFPDVHLAQSLTSFQALCYILNKASGKLHLWHIPLYFSTPLTINWHRKHVTYIDHAYCLSPPAPVDCKLHEGLEECLAHICWVNERMSKWYRALKEDKTRERHMGSHTHTHIFNWDIDAAFLMWIIKLNPAWRKDEAFHLDSSWKSH